MFFKKDSSEVLLIDMQWTGKGHPLQVYNFILVHINLQHTQAQPYDECTCVISLTGIQFYIGTDESTA